MEEAKACLQEVVEIHTGTGSWQHLARCAYYLTGRWKVEKVAPQHEVTMASGLTEAAVQIFMQQPGIKVSPQDGTALAQLHFALYKAKMDKEFMLAALARVPHIETSVLVKIAKYVKYCEGVESSDVI